MSDDENGKKTAETVLEFTRVVEQLEEDIVFGRLRPRERLVEDDLINRFEVKRHIVRQVLAELEKRNLVVRQRGRGARVYDYSPEEVRELYGFRKVLESTAASLIPLPASQALIDELTELHLTYAEAVEREDLRTIFRTNILFHQVLFGACGNRYLAEATNLYATKSNVVRFYAGQGAKKFAGSRDEHGEIIEALKAGDRERLVDLCIRHQSPSTKAYIDTYHRLFGET